VTALSPGQSVDFLSTCAGRETLEPGVVVGTTLAFWARALQFAGGLVAREQFLPGLAEEGSLALARWEPVLVGADALRFAQLARAMPPACRALAETADAPPTIPAATLLSAFLGTTVDFLVRSAIGNGTAVESDSRARSSRAKKSFDSVHDHWLEALRSLPSEIKATAEDCRQLFEQMETWRHPITITSSAPYRLCFRLEEPAGDDDEKTKAPKRVPWHLRYFLQGLADPSLMMPIADSWKAPSKSPGFPTDSPAVREYLLAALGQAAGICPFIEESLKSKSPEGQDLDATAAHGFLTERAGLLEQAGFGVLLPAWWSRKGTKVRLNVRARAKSPPMSASSGFTLDAIVHFEWQVALGDEVLSREELEMLAKLKQPLVKVRGQWVQLSSEEIQAALDFWQQRGSDHAKVREVMRMALGQAQLPGSLEFGGLTATGWVGKLLGELENHAGFEELPIPDKFHGTLRPYQIRGYSWLGFLRRWGLGACLADDMGLGKTVQTLALIQREWTNDSGRPTLLICPMSVVGNWQKEAQRFTPDLPVMVHHGEGRQKGREFRDRTEKHALVLSSYALLHRDFELLKEVSWAGVILDEAQNIKNSQTKQARAARSLPADYRIAITGTPVENHIGDLWSIMEFLNPGFLGTRAEFKRTFFVPIQAQQDANAANKLQRLTGPFILRRLKTDKSIIADLPDKLEMKVYCNLTKEQASLYEAVVKEMTEGLEAKDGIERKGLVLATLSKLKQVCNHPAQFLGDNSTISGRSGKLARLTEMLEEVFAERERALVFTQFSEMGEILRRHLQENFGREVLFLHGGVSKKQRDLMVERFQNDEHGPRVFLLSLKAGGTGLNLTAASHVFHFDRWWNPAVENQATDRAFRIGQKRRVQVHKFLCVGTLEEKIDEMIEHKRNVASKVVGSGEAWLTEMSNEQLKELLTLRSQALAE
jgi:SNF2 family DNA or RNA helicase